MKRTAGIKRIVLTALFVTVGIVLQTVEQFIPFFHALPGGKLGLANAASIAGILVFGGIYGTVIACLRAFFGCLLFGGISALPYSLCGAAFSSILMSALICSKQKAFSLVGVGVLGACAHNIAQIFVASIILTNEYIWTYLPPLLIISVFSGGGVGVCSNSLRTYLKAHQNIFAQFDRKVQ